MALRFSTGLRNLLLGKVPAIGGATITANTIAAVNGSPDSFTDSGNGFLTAGFQTGDTILALGFTTLANNGVFTISSAAAGTLQISETTVTNEGAGSNRTLCVIKGGSLKDIFKDGTLKIYSGSQPSDADQAVSGTLLVSITLGSGAFAYGAAAYGLEFGTASSGVIAKDSGVWSGVATASGTAGWFRLTANATDAGALSLVLPRIDGAIGTSGAQLNMSSTTITLGATTTIDTFSITFPAE